MAISIRLSICGMSKKAVYENAALQIVTTFSKL